jgi:(R,R)-butanediol dehydrogenase / meso-butanediol dehydrogenase / diacetyl reductase
VRAAVYHGPADVRVSEVPEPGRPGRGAVVLDVAMAAICGSDAAEWAHGPLLISLERPHHASGHGGPVIMGHEFVGRVAEVGDGVEGLVAGDMVVCGAGVSCGTCRWCRVGRTNLCASYYTLGFHADGGLAQRVVAPAAICLPTPEELGPGSAALAQPLAVALHAVRRSGVEADDTLAIVGVGGIGAFVVAAAHARGVRRIVAVDVDEARLETARRLGAATLVDARSADTVSAILDETGGEGAEVVIEASGAPHAPAAALAATRRGGRTVLVGLQSAPCELDLFAFTIREVDVVTTLAHVCAVDLPEAVAILASSDIASIVVDRTIPLDEIVDEGLRPLADGTAAGKILVATA